MAIYHVSGGGDALNTILRSSSTAQNSIIYVHPGIYTPYNVTTKSGLSVIGIGESRSDVVIRGLYWDGSEQKKSTAIAGNRIDVLSNMTLSGFTRTNLSIADIGYEWPAKTLRDCDIFDCKTILSSDPGIKGDLFHTVAFYNCHISGCTTGSYFFYGSVVQDCEINHNTMQYHSNAGSFFSTNDVRHNYVHDNFLRGYMQVNVQSYANIYENNNLNSNSFNNSSGIFANCLFIGNKNLNNFGYGCQYKNCVFVQNTTTGTAGNLYRPNLTGTSAQTQLRINNFYDVPLTSITNMQGLINNSQVDGKYALAEDNHFDVQLSDLGFIDPENHDYRLKSDSVLISAGTTRSDFTVRYGSKYFPSSNQLDIDGRRFKNPPSVGPYQYYKEIEGEIPNYINPVGQKERAVEDLHRIVHVHGGGTALRTAIANAKNGDTILVYDGVYTGSELRLNPSSISSLTIRSVNGPDNCIVKFHIYYNQGEYLPTSLTDTSWKTNSHLSAYGLTFKGYQTKNGEGQRRMVCINCIIDELSGNYGVAANSACLINCVVKNCVATQYPRLLQKAFAYNCVFMNNHIVPNSNEMFYNCSMHNYVCAGNTYGTSNTPITKITSLYYANGKNVSVSDLDANGRPIAGSECYGAGNAAYLQTSADFAGTPWKNPPAIGAFEEVD